MYKYIIILILLLAAFKATAKAENPDSLKAKAVTLFDEERYIEAIDTVNRAIELYMEKRDENGLARCYNNLGMILWKLNDTSNSMKYFKLARNYAETVSLELVSFVNTNIGHKYLEIYDLTHSYMYYYNVMKANEQSKGKYYYISLLNLANVLIEEKDYQRALKYILEAKKHYVQVQDSFEIQNCDNYLFDLYLSDGSQNNKLAEIINEYKQVDNFYFQKSIAFYYHDQGDYVVSNKILLTLLSKYKSNPDINEVYYKIAENYLDLNDFTKAIMYINEGLSLLNDLELDTKYKLHTIKSKILIQGKYFELIAENQSSLDSLHRLISARDLQTNQKLSNALIVSKYQLHTLEMNNQIIRKNLQIQQYIISLFFALVLLTIAGIYIRRLRIQKRRLSNSLNRNITINPFQIR